MGGVIPNEDEARRINAAVRAYEASATSRLTSRGHVPKKRLRIEPAVASPGSTTNTIGNCPCTSAPGVITPTVTAKFSHRQAYRWKRTGLMSMLNDIDGFSLTSEPVAVWNTDTPTNSYISADITRTVGADSDVYVLTVTEDSTHGWKLNFSIKSGASPNIADEIDWTEVCVSPNAPSPSKSNAVIVLDTETMTSEDGAYIDHPGCAGCLVPDRTRATYVSCDGGFPIPTKFLMTWDWPDSYEVYTDGSFSASSLPSQLTGAIGVLDRTIVTHEGPGDGNPTWTADRSSWPCTSACSVQTGIEISGPGTSAEMTFWYNSSLAYCLTDSVENFGLSMTFAFQISGYVSSLKICQVGFSFLMPPETALTEDIWEDGFVVSDFAIINPPSLDVGTFYANGVYRGTMSNIKFFAIPDGT